MAINRDAPVVYGGHIESIASRKRLGGTEIMVLVLISVTLIFVAGVLLKGFFTTSSDESARTAITKAHAAMTKYRATHDTFDGVTVSDLRAIDSSIPTTFDAPIAAGDSYRISAKTSAGVTYNLARNDAGLESRTCVAAPNGESGDCRVKQFGVGEW